LLQKRSKVAELKISVYDDEVKIEAQGITQIVKGETKGRGLKNRYNGARRRLSMKINEVVEC
jgi:hypothetical protein